MATDALPQSSQRLASDRAANDQGSLVDVLRAVLMPLASLRLTVVLLSFAIVLVFIGTLAQATDDVWNVVSHYFRSWIAFVPFQTLFPPSFFPEMAKDPLATNLGFWIPGGWTIGLLMAVNLLAAHGLRFKIAADGWRLLSGVAVIAAGCLLGWVVVATQQDSESLTGIISDEWNLLWTGVKIGVGLAWAACAYRLFAVPANRAWERWLWAVAGLTFGGLFCWLLVEWWNGGAAPLEGSYTRILWQLIKATAVALMLLAGCIMVFRKRGGIVLLHAGIGLMMANELVVYFLHVETQTTIYEGEKKNWTQDIRTAELAIIDRTNPAKDRVISIPKSLLLTRDRDNSPRRISDDRLPFDIELNRYIVNSRMHEVVPTDVNPATAGIGSEYVAREYTPGTGTDVGGQVDFPAAYVTLFEKGTDKQLGTYLTSPIIDDGVIVIEQPDKPDQPQASRQVGPERVKVGDQKFDLVLRYHRYYLPYTIELKDFRKDDYLGTKTPRNFSSDVTLIDPERNLQRDVHISMNNPYRYRGDTLYQSGFTPDQRGTTLSIVSNQGWMVPYLSCMIVVIGLLAHFTITLLRFIQRRTGDAPTAMLVANSIGRGDTVVPVAQAVHRNDDRFRATARTGNDHIASVKPVTAPISDSQPEFPALARWFPMAVVVIAGLYLASKARMPSTEPTEMDLTAFGQLAVMEGGRVKPFDTLARQSLTQISDRQTYVDADDERQPAIRWLLDVIAKPSTASTHAIVRIHNTGVLAILKLEPVEGSRYSLDQISENSEQLETEVAAIRKRNPDGGSADEKKLLDLDRRLGVLRRLRAAFMRAPAEQFIAMPEVRQDPERAIGTVRSLFSDLKNKDLPLVVPGKIGEDWLPYSIASDDILRMLNANQRVEPSQETVMLGAIFDAYAANNAGDFNRAVGKYRDYIDGNPPSQLSDAWIKFETFFNHFEPFYYASVLYVVAFILAALAWLGWSKPLNQAAFYLVLFTFAFHTAALVGRMLISGRPPVTNLYSSAIFIAWGCVGLGLILEMIYRLGLGTMVAAIAGFASLVIAHLLATVVPGHNGDTMGVLQAVLDTQFWLATHVVCITLGYSTTFVAGIFGLMYVVMGLMTKALNANLAKDLSRMIYGTLCFAIFFSFFGTVLGGLWADDSWGRFWGWDPKENGALIIVLWNALILHARWGGMVKERGMAVLAIGGNIVTMWSWFGVNELGKGLHSYGFTEGVLAALGWFVLSQFVFMALGSLPKNLWASFRTTNVA